MSLEALSQKKAKIGRPKLAKGEAKGRIVPVRFAPDEIKAIVCASRAANQTVSEWLREIARFGTMYQPLAAHGWRATEMGGIFQIRTLPGRA